MHPVNKSRAHKERCCQNSKYDSQMAQLDFHTKYLDYIATIF